MLRLPPSRRRTAVEAGAPLLAPPSPLTCGRLRQTLLPTVAALLLATAAASAQTDLGADDIDRIARAVVRVVALRNGEAVSLGSGTVVRRTGLVTTNRHVVEGADDYRIDVLDDANELPVPRYRATLIGYSMEPDFAVLQIDRSLRGQPLAADRLDLPSVSLAAESPRRGDYVALFGYPGIADGYLLFTEGVVTTIRNGTLNDRRLPAWYQTDAEIAPGNSGGLAVNARGEMVGIPTRVTAERRTGGRLAGILALNAIAAALDAGLETDMSRIVDSTSIPGPEDILEPRELPTFGTIALSAGFTPDPHTVWMVSSGTIAADHLGRSCTGYAAVAPDFRLEWSGESFELRIFFVPDAVRDTTLIINLPDGSWICNDDANGTLHPMVTLRNPPRGQYGIWVGSLTAGALVAGTAHITERDLDPVTVEASALNWSAEPNFGSVELRAGFRPDPYWAEVLGGGTVDVSYLGGDCVGHASREPDVRLRWRGHGDALSILFTADEEYDDTSLVVNLPDGTWACNDDAAASLLDPLIVLERPREGRYDIWIGSYERDQFISGTLGISQLDLRR